jgi:hypothetical protein
MLKRMVFRRERWTVGGSQKGSATQMALEDLLHPFKEQYR